MNGAETAMSRAAVLIPLIRTDEGAAILLEVRSRNVRQPGEICFPGGHTEKGESAVDTALRETYEELGIPASSVKVMRELEPEFHSDNILVFPVLAMIEPAEPGLTLLPEEVSEVFALPLAWLKSHEPAVCDLSDPESPDLPLKLRQYLKNYKRIRGGRTTYYWEYGGHGIWGLTARMLYRLRQLPELPC